MHADASARNVTGTTTETTLETITVPADALGENGVTELTIVFDTANGGTPGNKTLRIDWDGTTVYTLAVTSAIAGSDVLVHAWIVNTGSASSQYIYGFAVFEDEDGTKQADVFAGSAAVDTTADVDIDITGQLADSGDIMTLVLSVLRLGGTL